MVPDATNDSDFLGLQVLKRTPEENLSSGGSKT